MKVAFIGSQGVGKTTLFRLLQNRFPEAAFVKETIRDCPYPLDEATDFKTQWWALAHSILAEQEAKESLIQRGSDIIISDRCLIDVAVYTEIIHKKDSARISHEQKELIYQSIRSWLEIDPYDILFFVKVNPEQWLTRDLDDSFRSTNLDWFLSLESEYERSLALFDTEGQTTLRIIQNNGNIQDTFNEVLASLLAPLMAPSTSSLATRLRY